MPWPLLAFAAAFSWASANTLDKIASKKYLKEAMTTLIVIGVFSALITPVVCLIADVKLMSLSHGALGLASGMAYAVMQACYMKAVEKAGDITRIIPLYSLVPLLIAIFAANIFDELFSAVTYIGGILILVGAYWISAERFFTPIAVNEAFWWMMGGVAASVVCQLIPKGLLGSYSYWTVYAYSRVGSIVAIALITWHARAEILDLIRRQRYKPLGIVSSSASCHMGGSLFSLLALTTGPITLVTAMVQVQPLLLLGITVILSYYMSTVFAKQKSKVIRQKLWAILILGIGVVLVNR